MSQFTSIRANWAFWARLVVVAFVLGTVVFTGVQAYSQLREESLDFRGVNYFWWLGALVSYIVTLLFSCFFWHRVLLSMGQKPTIGRTMMAFFASQLGKYIPGKAMVVVIRTDLIRSDDVRTAPAAASVFVETLTWIFVGSAIASLLLIFLFKDQVVMQVVAAVLTIGAGVLTWPSVFKRIAIKMGAAKGRNAETMFDGLNLATMSVGWTVMTVGWCLNGFSLWLVLKGLPGTEVALGDFPLALACVSLATVAGFVSLLPGGIGVRELVMIPLLGGQFGVVTAVIAAIVIRIVWLTAELLTSGIIYFGRRFSTQ